MSLSELGETRPYAVLGDGLAPVRPTSVLSELTDAGTVWLGEQRDLTDDNTIAAGIVAALAMAKSAAGAGSGAAGAPLGVGLEAVRSEYQWPSGDLARRS